MFYYSVNPDKFPKEWNTEDKERFYTSWNNTLKVITDYIKLYKDKKIIKGISYYPRLKNSEKRGLRAFNELKKTHFPNNDSMLNWLIKQKILPEPNINYFKTYQQISDFNSISSLQDCKTKDVFKHLFLFKSVELGYILESETPPNAIIINDVNIIQFEDKVKIITDYFESLEFTASEMCKAISILSMYLSDNIYKNFL